MNRPATRELTSTVNETKKSAPLRHVGLAVWSVLLVGLISQCTAGTESVESRQTIFDQTDHDGSFAFQGFGPHPATPIRVWYFAPDVELASARILVVIPGRGRNADEYRDQWSRAAEEAESLLLVPEFPADIYPFSQYNLGNMADEAGEILPENAWTFSVVEAMFDYVREEINSGQPGYYLYGHSAGAQFVHRLIMFTSNNHVLHAVSANAGWYTVLDDEEDFPYGLSGSPTLSSRRRMIEAPLTVLLGSEDDDPDSDGLRTDKPSLRQGATRLERGRYFFDAGQLMADELDTPLAWNIRVVPGATHDNQEMVDAAAEILFA